MDGVENGKSVKIDHFDGQIKNNWTQLLKIFSLY